MKPSENFRHLLSLPAAVKKTQIPLLLFYAASNRMYRAVGVQICKEATLRFDFGAFRVLANCGDLGTIGEIFIQRPYQALKDFIPHDGDTCLDIGANIGCVSLQWRLANPTGRIIAVEPHPTTFARMTENFGLNRVKPMESIQAAIGSTDGHVDMVIDEGKNSMARVVGDHLRYIEPFQRSTTVSVRCITIDTLVSERKADRINLLKIDVEGFEVECLRGAAKTLEITDRVVLEYHSDELGESCRAMLAASGFACEHNGTLLFARKQTALSSNASKARIS